MREKESVIKKGVLGILIGLAVIIPGISGSVIAIIFKLYNKILYAVANIIKDFKYSIRFLFPIAVGAIFGLAVGFFTIQRLLKVIPWAIICLFAGLMLGAIPSLTDEVKEINRKRKYVILGCIGFSIPLIMTSLPFVMLSGEAQKLTIDFTRGILYFCLGILVAITQFVPGCSATALLLSLGYFTPLMESIHISYIQKNPSVLGIYSLLFLGFIFGCFGISRLLNFFLQKYGSKMYFIFIGLSIGSILCLFFNIEMIGVYQGLDFWDNIVGICLFILGGIISYKLVGYERRKTI